MGYSYGRDQFTGRLALACDHCPTVGGVRKRHCPIRYCPAPALCPKCNAGTREKQRAYHAENCYPAKARDEQRDQLRRTIHANDWIPIAAWGDWAARVPEGMVGVVATRAGERVEGCEERCFLLPAAEYHDNSSHGPWCVIGLAQGVVPMPAGFNCQDFNRKVAA